MHEKYTFLTLYTDRGDAIMIKKGGDIYDRRTEKVSKSRE